MKKLLKKILILFSILTLFLGMIGIKEVQAATTVKFGLQEYRKARSNGYQYGYKVGNNKPVWKIVKYGNNGTSFTYDNAIYCLKAEKGFFTTNPGNFTENYNLSYDFKNKSSMPTLPVPEKYYNAILWILNHSYIPGSGEASKNALLKAAGIPDSTEITDDDIDVVQQLAIWYFTNEESSDYHKDYAGKPTLSVVQRSSKSSSGVESDYQSINDLDEYLRLDMETLFEYFVTNAKKAENTAVETGSPLSLISSSATATISGNNYIIGPFKIEKKNSLPYTLSIAVTDQKGSSLAGKYTVLNANKVPVSGGIEATIGQEFYLQIPTSHNPKGVKIAINGTYETTDMTYWTVGGAYGSTQPIVIIEKKDHPFDAEASVNLPTVYQLKLLKVDSTNPNQTLEGATFEITKPGGSKETVTTNEDGEIILSNLLISNASTQTFTIKETKPPTGYQSLISSITLNITTKLVDGRYVLGNVSLSPESENATVNLSGTTIQLKIKNQPTTGFYHLKLLKVASTNPNKTLAGAVFEITKPDTSTVRVTTNASGEINLRNIGITEAGTHIYTIKEITPPEGYKKLMESIVLRVTTELKDGEYVVTNVSLSPENNNVNAVVQGTTVQITVKDEPITGAYHIKLIKVDQADTSKTLKGAIFEITKPNGEKVELTTDENGAINLENIGITEVGTQTFTIKEKQAPNGYDSLIDTITLKVTTQLKNEEYVVSNVSLSPESENATVSLSGTTVQILVKNIKVTGSYNLKLLKVDKKNHDKVLQGAVFEITKPNGQKEELTTDVNGAINLQEIEITKEGTEIYKIKEIKAPNGYNMILKEEITLTITTKKENSKYVIDSVTISPENEALQLSNTDNSVTITVENGEFDLALRKFITGVNDVNYIGREPQVDVTNLANGTETTAIYNHPKTPINVSRGDTVIYTIRVYNEGNIAGYANEITDYLPEELEFLPDDELNKQYEWEVSEDGRTVTTRYLSKEKESGQRENLIDGFNGSKLDYKDVKIKCKVKDTAEFGKKLTNLAEITEDKDQDGSDVVDRDSDPDNIDLPSDEELPGYKDEEIENGDKYIPGQEDDDDFEKVKVVYFDLALRKFITGVNDTEVTNRIPEVSKGEDGNLDYNHTKDPVEVENGNVVTYTLRIYNEGLMSGYANKVADDVPDGLVFLPENEINKEYRWVMYKPADENAENPEEPSEEQNKEETQAKDKEDQAGNEEDQDNTEEDRIEAEEEITYGGKKYVRTDNPEEATLIQTDYLSKEQEKEEGANLIRAFDPEKEISSEEPYNPDYRDIKIAFKVTEPNTSDRIIVNTAEITDDRDETNEPVEDVDSTPGNNNEWETEDDLDKEFIKVKYFDLALRKIVSKAIIIEDGKQTVIETNHQFEDDPEEIVKVDLHRKDLDKVTVKFEFRIRVTNEGEIAGYAKEVTDYIPEGLKFVQEDNPGWYPRESLDGRERVGTRALENTLLQPGESAEVSILLTWINGSDNVGLKTNWAEISEDYNDSNTPDIDSIPDNFKEGEDDIDEAPVMLSIELGQERIFYGLTILVLATIGAGTILIKKFVLH